MLAQYICHFRGVGSILSLLFYFWMENPISKHHDASGLGPHCLPKTLYGFPSKNGLTVKKK